MIKVILPGSYDFGMPAAQLVDVHRYGVDRSWMVKRAAVLNHVIRDLRPEPNSSYIHLISMGCQEAFGCNRNGDGFNEKAGSFELFAPKPGQPKIYQMQGGLTEFHPTFEKYAHVYKHHNNKDPKGAIGEVKAAAYNPDMRRGELIIKVPHNKEWNEDLEKLANGKDIPFSMACKVAYDVCTGCGNKAKTRADYCDHLKDQMTDIVKSGHQVFAINDVPTFFDISKVFRPADRIAWSLQKVASADLAPIGGAELAEMMDVSASSAVLYGDSPANFVRKMAAAKKLAAIEKLIEGTAQGQDNKHLKSLSRGTPDKDISEKDMETLKQGNLRGVLNALACEKIALSVNDFTRLVMGPNDLGSIAGNAAQIKQLLPGMYGQLLKNGEAEECANDSSYDGESASIPRHVRELIEKLAGDYSLADGPAQRRIRISIIRGDSLRPLNSDSLKMAAVSKSAQVLAKEYAKYQLAFVAEVGEDETSSMLTCLGNHCRN